MDVTSEIEDAVNDRKAGVEVILETDLSAMRFKDIVHHPVAVYEAVKANMGVHREKKTDESTMKVVEQAVREGL